MMTTEATLMAVMAPAANSPPTIPSTTDCETAGSIRSVLVSYNIIQISCMVCFDDVPFSYTYQCFS